jgi:hypothetical protein
MKRGCQQRDDPGVHGSRQLRSQTFDDGISLGELQRQHLDVLRERPGERPQLRHLGTTHGA